MLTDHSKMVFGFHQDKQLGKVPLNYLIGLYQQTWCPTDLREYIDKRAKENLNKK